MRCMILWHMILKMVEAGGRTFAMYRWLSSGSATPLGSWAQDLAMLGSCDTVFLALHGPAGRKDLRNMIARRRLVS